MIVPFVAQDDESKPALASGPVTREAMTEIPPPAYEAHSPVQPVASAVPPHLKPANFIAITRRMGELKDTFVLDPTLVVPHAMRPRNEYMHLSLSALLGEVAAVVYIVGSDGLPSGSKTRMEVFSTMGATRLELHAEEPRAPMAINMSARLGEASLLLPRSFRGPLRISVMLGEVELSPALRAATRSFGDGGLFVGDWRKGELEQETWNGDEAVLDSKMGSVYVGYDDEKKG
ncbi:hypothetical protein DFH07DRAFT_57452 [Mycena maculata]|uniref:DUF7330 domain-containing protein n=1 Tax=Mycena maculata TaxID=230809 RepID=A0AAD7IER6_9AGAR|nr:hypothetical protein DFH07DRAFT_57452 [Mycena maculata]